MIQSLTSFRRSFDFELIQKISVSVKENRGEKWISRYSHFWLHSFWRFVLLHPQLIHKKSIIVRINRNLIFVCAFNNSRLFHFLYFDKFESSSVDDLDTHLPVSCGAIGGVARCALGCFNLGYRTGYCDEKDNCTCKDKRTWSNLHPAIASTLHDLSHQYFDIKIDVFFLFWKYFRILKWSTFFW